MKGSIPTIHNDLGIINIGPGASFSEIPEQVRESSIREGFVFNLLVVGRRGLGCSTLINSLFSTQIVPCDRTESINTTVNEIIENNVKLTISVTTYHGDDFDKVINFIENLDEEYFESEQGLNIPFHDKRIHCCIYLVPADTITENEKFGVEKLSKKVNLIPVITKRDMFTVEELQSHRNKINRVFEDSRANFYNYGEQDMEEFPMAIIASENVYEENGQYVRGRKYLWGSIDIENKKFSDFKKLQRIIISDKFIDLIHLTDTVFYKETRQELIKKETPTSIKERLTRIILQLEKVVDIKYQSIINELKEEEETESFIAKTEEMSLEQESSAIQTE